MTNLRDSGAARRDTTSRPPAAPEVDGGGGRSLYRDRDYRMLWTGQTVNHVGDAVSTMALPLLAITTLHIDALQSGSLRAAEQVTALLSVPLGVLVDRLRRRRLMVCTDLLRTVVTALVPVAALAGFLSFSLLLLVALAMGLLDSLFSIASNSHLPEFLSDRDRVAGTAQLGTGRFGALTSGYALGGILVGAAGAARALFIDSASFVVSALTLLSIRRPEPVIHRPSPDGASSNDRASGGPAPVDRGQGFAAALTGWRREMGAGARHLRADPRLGVVALTGTGVSFALSLSIAVEMLFLVQDLHASALGIGLVYGLPVLAGVLGSQLSIRLMGRMGPARVMRSAVVVYAPAIALPALTPAGPLGLTLAGCCWTVLILVASAYNASANVLRQQLTPPAARGRINATIRTLTSAAKLFALLLGGLIGTLIGLRGAILASALCMLLPTALLLSSGGLVPAPPIPAPDPGTGR
jgi:MFS family permease